MQKTPDNDIGGDGGRTIFLDRHQVVCPGTSAMSSFKFVTNGNNRGHYEYWCVEVKNAGPRVDRFTDWNDEGGGLTWFLDRHSPQCSDGEVLTGFELQRRNGNQIRYHIQCETASVLGKNKLPVCLFLHGAMVHGARPTAWKTNYGEVVGALKSYWGDYNHWYADVCESFVYSWAETAGHAWTDKNLQSDYADKAAEVIAKGGIVFGHSMANAILAGACYQQGKCVQWYSLGGGYSGQAVGDTVEGIIDIVQGGPGAITAALIAAAVDPKLLPAAEIIGRLVGGPIRTFINDDVFQGFSYRKDGMRLGTNKNAMARKVDDLGLLKGSLCGVQAAGSPVQLQDSQLAKDALSNIFNLLSFESAVKQIDDIDSYKMSLAMQLVASLVSVELVKTKHVDTRSDGLVETNACAYWTDDVTTDQGRHWYGIKKPWPEYGAFDTPKKGDTHILARINHIEECGVFPRGGSAVALKWMRNMMCNEIEAKGGVCSAWGGQEKIPYEWAAPNGQIGDACDPTGIQLKYACKGANVAGAGMPHQFDYAFCFHFDCLFLIPFPHVLLGTWCCQADGKGMCQNKVRDWAGAYYCASDCVGKFLGSPGTCELGLKNGIGDKCFFDWDCGTGSCCAGQCANKKKDWAGLFWCPNECKSSFFSRQGSC